MTSGFLSQPADFSSDAVNMGKMRGGQFAESKKAIYACFLTLSMDVTFAAPIPFRWCHAP